VIQNVISVVIAVSIAIGKIRLNAEIAFGQLKNFSNVAVSSRIGLILNHHWAYDLKEENLKFAIRRKLEICNMTDSHKNILKI